jgi:hypothetical protein
MKNNGTWAKCSAIYPMVGGTASTHKFNLKNPLDTNAAFRLSFSGGWTHSANGALPNGTNAYANTFLIPNTLSNTNHHLSYYSRTQSTTGGQIDIGAEVVASNNNFALDLYFGSLSIKAFVSSGYPTYSVTSANNDTLGFTIGTRTSNTSAKLFQEGVLLSTLATNNSPSTLPNRALYIGANNNVFNAGAGGSFSVKQCAFASIGSGLTDAEALALYNSIQAMQVTLSRQV